MTTASQQAPVSLPSLQEMIAACNAMALVAWHPPTGAELKAAADLLQSIAAPDEAMVERLAKAAAIGVGLGNASEAFHRRGVRAVLSALSGEAR